MIHEIDKTPDRNDRNVVAEIEIKQFLITVCPELKKVFERSIGTTRHYRENNNKADKDNNLLLYRFKKQICATNNLPHNMSEKDADLDEK